MTKPVPDPGVIAVRDFGAIGASIAAIADIPASKAALGLMIAACDHYGSAHGFEHVAGWLRVMAETYERNYPVERPEAAIVH